MKTKLAKHLRNNNLEVKVNALKSMRGEQKRRMLLAAENVLSKQVFTAKILQGAQARKSKM